MSQPRVNPGSTPDNDLDLSPYSRANMRVASGWTYGPRANVSPRPFSQEELSRELFNRSAFSDSSDPPARSTPSPTPIPMAPRASYLCRNCNRRHRRGYGCAKMCREVPELIPLDTEYQSSGSSTTSNLMPPLPEGRESSDESTLPPARDSSSLLRDADFRESLNQLDRTNVGRVPPERFPSMYPLFDGNQRPILAPIPRRQNNDSQNNNEHKTSALKYKPCLSCRYKR